MEEKKPRSNVGAGVLLILLGLLFLSFQLMPELWSWVNLELSWPLIVVGVGVFLLVLGLLLNAPGMAIPAVIVGGIGGILYYQNLTGDWASWAYAWALIPGFVGLGIILAGLLGEGSLREALSGGAVLLLISMILFVVFGSFLGGPSLSPYWPVLLIGVGLVILLRATFRKEDQ